MILCILSFVPYSCIYHSMWCSVIENEMPHTVRKRVLWTEQDVSMRERTDITQSAASHSLTVLRPVKTSPPTSYTGRYFEQPFQKPPRSLDSVRPPFAHRTVLTAGLAAGRGRHASEVWGCEKRGLPLTIFPAAALRPRSFHTGCHSHVEVLRTLGRESSSLFFPIRMNWSRGQKEDFHQYLFRSLDFLNLQKPI